LGDYSPEKAGVGGSTPSRGTIFADHPQQVIWLQNFKAFIARSESD